MAISALDKELLGYFTRLNELQKRSLVEMIKTFIKSGYELDKRVSIEQYNQELDDAMKRISLGEFTSLEELEKEIGSW